MKDDLFDHHNLRESFEEHTARAPKVKLTAAEEDELKRRSENHSADKAITALRAELKGINLSMAILKEARDIRTARIKELEANKRTVGRGGI